MINFIFENWIALLSILTGIILFIWIGTRPTSTINPTWRTDTTNLNK